MAQRTPTQAGNIRLHVVYSLAIAVLAAIAIYAIYCGIDTAITLSYRDQQTHELEATRKQLMSVLPTLTRGRTKAEIVEAFEQVAGEEAREKDGCSWIGMVGMKFSTKGELVHVSPIWSYGSGDPCFPP